MVRVLDILITLGAGLLLAMVLYVASYFILLILDGWSIILYLLLFPSAHLSWPIEPWYPPLALLPFFASVAALWVALVLQTRRLMGFAEEPGTATPFGHWSVQRSCAVFSIVNFVAWLAHASACILLLTVNSIDLANAPLLATVFAQQQLALLVGVALVIAVPNYGYLPVVWLEQLVDSASASWRAWRDHRLLGKEPREERLRKQSMKRKTQRISVGASELDRFPSTSSTFRAVVAPTAFWLASAEGFGEELKGMSKPIVTIVREQCSICEKNLDTEGRVLRCPHCGAGAHERHFLKWLTDNLHCPRCRKPLTPYDLVEG